MSLQSALVLFKLQISHLPNFIQQLNVCEFYASYPVKFELNATLAISDKLEMFKVLIESCASNLSIPNQRYFTGAQVLV